MLSRFLQLRGPVQKALIDLDQQYESAVTDAEFTVIQEIVSCPESLKLVVNALRRCDTNLVSAEVALKFCIVQLQKQRFELAKTLAEVLESRIKERRGQHSAVMQYLHDSSARQSATEVFPIPSNDVIRKCVRRLVTRLDIASSIPSPAETSTSQSGRPGIPGIKMSIPEFPGMKKRVRECIPYLRMKFSAWNVNFSSPSPDSLDSSRPAQVGVNERYPRKKWLFILCWLV